MERKICIVRALGYRKSQTTEHYTRFSNFSIFLIFSRFHGMMLMVLVFYLTCFKKSHLSFSRDSSQWCYFFRHMPSRLRLMKGTWSRLISNLMSIISRHRSINMPKERDSTSRICSSRSVSFFSSWSHFSQYSSSSSGVSWWRQLVWVVRTDNSVKERRSSPSISSHWFSHSLLTR